MVQIEIDYRGDLRACSSHGPSGTELLTDAPKDNRGKGESYSPTDLVATALGTCMVTIMAMAARDRGVELAGTRVKVTKEMVADPLRRIGRLRVEFEMAPGVPEEHRRALEHAAETCPVAQSISERIDVPVSFRY